MVLADVFQISKEQKLSFTSLAFQAEYGDGGEDEQHKDEFIIEHYASNDLINEVRSLFVGQESFEEICFSSMVRVIYVKKSWNDNDSMRN